MVEAEQQFGAQRAADDLSKASTPSGFQSPIPPPPPPPFSGKETPKQNWKQVNGYSSKPDSDSSSVNGERTPKRIDYNGQNIPAAIANAFADPRKDKKPFSYFPGGFAPDLSDKPTPSAVKRSNQSSPAPIYNVPKVLPIVSDEQLRFEEQRQRNPSRDSNNQKMPITHVQYNDPINLYSKDSLNEAVQQAVGVPTEGSKSGSVPRSGTYRLIQEQERGGGARSGQDGSRDDYPHYQGYTDPRVQSPSIRRLGQVTGTESSDDQSGPIHGRVYSPENPDPTFRRGAPQDAQTRWEYDTVSQIYRAIPEVWEPNGEPYEAKGADRPRAHRCDDPDNSAYHPAHPPKNRNPSSGSCTHSCSRSTSRSPNPSGHARQNPAHQNPGFGSQNPGTIQRMNPDPMERYREEPMDPNLAAKIAAAERPKVPQQSQPHWASAAEQKRKKWDNIMTQEEQKAAERTQRNIAWNEPTERRFAKGSDKDKWQKHYSAYSLESGRNLPRGGGYRRYSPRRTTGQVAVEGKEPWLRPYVAPNVGVVKYRPQPAMVQKSRSASGIYGSAGPAPLSFGLYYGSANPHDHHSHAQQHEVHRHRGPAYHRPDTNEFPRQKLRASSYEHDFLPHTNLDPLIARERHSFVPREPQSHTRAPVHHARAAQLSYIERERAHPVSSTATHQKLNWPPAADQGQGHDYESTGGGAPYSKTTNYTKKTWDRTESTQNGTAAVGNYSNPGGYQYESDAEKQRRYMEDEMGRRVANAPPPSAGNPGGNPGNPSVGAPQGWKPPPTTTTSVSGGTRPPWRPVSTGLPDSGVPSGGQYESSAPFGGSSVSPYAPTGGAPFATAPYTGTGTPGGSAYPKWQGQPGTHTKAHATGSYLDPEGNKVAYTKEVYTTADPGKEFSMLTEEERKILEQPLQPGVVSRHVTTKYYKKSTFTSNTTTNTTDTPPVTSLPGFSQLSITDRPGSVGPGVTQF